MGFGSLTSEIQLFPFQLCRIVQYDLFWLSPDRGHLCVGVLAGGISSVVAKQRRVCCGGYM